EVMPARGLFPLFFLRGRGRRLLLGRDGVAARQPAAQVDGLAARAAEGELRPGRQILHLHRLAADRAGHARHRAAHVVLGVDFVAVLAGASLLPFLSLLPVSALPLVPLPASASALAAFL